ncbi:Xaa-Pro dipeptidase [Pasteurellaceae bacterium Macca]|nr:Xaa-Pro dipeptidase [Pasteurellaceae bacterium Macca]
MKQLFEQHITQLQSVVRSALEQAQLAGLWIHAGTAHSHFLDDQSAPFRINPHFNYVFPDPLAENSWLFLDGVNPPKVYFYAPQDYWHCTPSPPTDAFFGEFFQWQIMTQANEITAFLGNVQHCAFIGENVVFAENLGFSHINPKKVLNVLHFARSIKSEFEIACLYQAQFNALKGHQAAKQAFFAGESEFEINLAYLRASEQSDSRVPYGNIVALNQHGAILHYTHLDLARPAERHSLLIDAGASYLGYASDITRSYALDSKSEFAELIAKMDQLKLNVVDSLAVGVNYLAYHTQMHQWIADLLAEHQFIKLSGEQIFEEGISRTFFPHGLGHQLGLQVHDVAGFQQNVRGTHKAPPEAYPSLRCTRDLAPNMVLTIEPGFYFIEMLLTQWLSHPLSSYFNWDKIRQFQRFGGIRTEDNVVIRLEKAENLTAKAEQNLK